MQVIFISSYWLHFWSTMLPQEKQDTMRNGATLLKSVIFISSYWLHFWSTMLPQEKQDTMRNGATLLKSVAKGLLFHYEWRSSIRIAS
uniref:Uncharacterized protein n=1 Tax=Oryza meridionalis TaxID=40149 RepID=A0A0E0F9K5_9ORYZ